MEIFSVLKRHPLVFAAVYLPAVVSAIVAATIYRSYAYFFFPLLWCFFLSLFLIEGVEKGRLTDNLGTTTRHRTPILFWAKVGIWSFFYVLGIAFCIGYALQERRKQIGEPSHVASESLLGGQPGHDQ